MTSVKAKTFVRVERRWTTNLELSSRTQKKTSPKRRYRHKVLQAHRAVLHLMLDLEVLKLIFYFHISRVMEAVAGTSHVSVALAWSCMLSGSTWMKTHRRRRSSSVLNVCMRSSNAFQMKRTWSWVWTPNIPVLSGWSSQCCPCPLLLWDQLWSCRALLETRLAFLIKQWERSLMYCMVPIAVRFVSIAFFFFSLFPTRMI